MIRSTLAVVGGLFAGFFLILAGQMLSQMVYPPPPGLDVKNPDSVAAAIEVTPTGAFVLVLISWAVGTFMAAGIAARIAPSWKIGFGMLIGALLLVSSILNMSGRPYPGWFWAVGVAEFLPVAYFGARLVTLGNAERPPLTD